MIKLCRVDEVRAAERAAIVGGRTESDLMVAAGRGVGQTIRALGDERPGTAVFLVGPGHNGGDGLVAASALTERGWRCLVWGYEREGLAGAPIPSERAGDLDWVPDLASLTEACAAADVVVDAVFGVGGRLELPDAVADAFDVAWQARIDHGTQLWALDIPSGTDADDGRADERAFRADHTVMIGLPKVGLYRGPAVRHTGVLHLVDIGLVAPDGGPIEPRLVTEGDVRRWLPRRPADTHKRAVGTLLVIGGAPNYYGAPRLAATAAARVGAGLVSLAVPRSLIAPISTAFPEVTFIPLPEGELGGAGNRMAQMVREVLDAYRALLVGPGLGQDPPVDEFLSAFFGVRGSIGAIGFGASRLREAGDTFHGRAVIDADGLNWLAARPEWSERLKSADLVLTPHPGELGRLLGANADSIVTEPWAHALEAARRFEQVVVLKQAHTVVASPDGTLLVAPQALASLASAGTGDVLSGTIAGLMAQGLPSREAAAAGVVIGTRAALLAEREVGTLGLLAGDLLRTLAPAVRDLYDPC